MSTAHNIPPSVVGGDGQQSSSPSGAADRARQVDEAFQVVERSRKQQTRAMIRRIKMSRGRA